MELLKSVNKANPNPPISKITLLPLSKLSATDAFANQMKSLESHDLTGFFRTIPIALTHFVVNPAQVQKQLPLQYN